ncbi:MAG TPA: response regulator [Candidatus Onthovicinus excrementipullorum]|nr:response regulator [Candidatus Onthovicinus excrementipullorum]
MPQKNSVLIVSSGPKVGALLTELLPPASFSPICTVPTAGEARRMLVDRHFDIAVINTPLPDDFGTQLAVEISEKQGCGVLLLVKAEIQEAVGLKVEDYGILTLPKPVSRQMVFQSMKLLAATRQKIRALEERTSSLQSKMEEIRLVNRAKLLLIEHLKMSEPEAHHYIEKRAMDTCVKRRAIAENIIKTYEN